MSKNALVLERIESEARATPITEAPRSGEYLELIRRHFRPHSAVAIVAAGPARNAADVCEKIAAELAASGNRVVIVPGNALLQMNPGAPPEASDCSPARTPNVWFWPPAAGARIEFFNSNVPSGHPAGPWLDSLRQSFDSVLLDCPSVEVAAMADVAVLVVEAGRTTRQQIQHGQRALQLGRVPLAGCILLQRR